MLNEKTYNLESGEFENVKNEYLALETRALRQYGGLPEALKDAYKQLILHPVRAMANLYDMYYGIAMNYKLAAEKDLRANYWADHTNACFERDAAYSKDYNTAMSEGKWNHMMDQTHIGYKSWDEPKEGNIRPKVIRIMPEEAKKGGYVFSEKNGVVAMEAEHYFEAKANPKTSWTVIPGLGRTLSGIALMPYTEEAKGSAISYKLKMNSNPAKVKVHLYFSCTLPFKNGGHEVAVSFDGGKEQRFNINKDLTWANNYLKMYPAAAERMIEIQVELDVPNIADATHILNVRPQDPGVVLYKVVVDNGGFEQTRLKMDESPYNRN